MKFIKGFTLLECLIALLVISGAIQVYQALNHLFVEEVAYFSNNQKEEWLLFSQQLSGELLETKFIKVENDKLYVIKDNQHLAFGLSKSGDFRKTNADGRGYQPMLFEVEDCQISQSAHLVRIDIILSSGLERSFIYDFGAES